MSTPQLTYRDRAGVRVDLEKLVTSRLLLTANSGGGKSHAIRQLLEETHGKIPQIVIDREGEFSTLREKFPYLLVGPGGEVAADLRSAATLARKLLELGVSAVIDLSEMDLKTQRQYVAAFADSISHAPRELWHDVLVIIDEAYLFAPQKLKKGEGTAAASLAALSLAASTWRKRGYCMVLATTRVSKLDKDISGEMLNKLIGRTSEEDRKRAAEELGIDQNTAREMRAFKEGTFWAYGPAISDVPVLVHTEKELKTRPPKRGAAREAAPPTPAAIRAIADALADLPKEAAEEARTIDGLQRQLHEVKRKLQHAEKTGVGKIVEKPVVDQKAIDRAIATAMREHAAVVTALEKALDAAMKFIINVSTANFDVAGVDKAELEKAITAAVDRATKLIGDKMEARARDVRKLKADAERILEALRAVRGQHAPKEIEVKVAVTRNEPFRVSAPALPRAPREPSSDDGSLPKGERQVLIAIAQHGDEGVTREQLTQLTGYKRSTRDAYIQRMVPKGIVALNGDRIVATQEGIAVLGNDYELLPTGDELREHWLSRLPEGEAKILGVLADAYPQSVSRDVVSEQTSYARSSRDAYIQRLLRRKLITTTSEGVRMSDNLNG